MIHVMAWTWQDVISLAIICLIMPMVAGVYIATLFKQWRCLHLNVGESRACDAVCLKCGKNLGFIGEWRKKQKGKA